MRVYTSANDPLDFCKRCTPTQIQALARYGSIGDGPNARGNCFAYDEDHPDYLDSGYRCEHCKRELADDD